MMALLWDLTSGVIFMHGLGEIHRDLKPHNGKIAFTLCLML